jgi:hypothetical protein
MLHSWNAQPPEPVQAALAVQESTIVDKTAAGYAAAASEVGVAAFTAVTNADEVAAALLALAEQEHTLTI